MKFFTISIVIAFLTFGNIVLCQDKLKFGDTPTTSMDPKYRHNHKHYQTRQIVHWIKNDSKGLLIGNPCMEDVMNEMGFTYLIQFKGEPGQKKALARYLHNKKTKTILFFRNGPFWKYKLNKRRRECRLQTRDFVG